MAKQMRCGQRRQRLFEQAVVPGQRGGGIAVERRADRGRDVGQGHVLGMKEAVAVEEMVHRRVFRCERSATGSVPAPATPGIFWNGSKLGSGGGPAAEPEVERQAAADRRCRRWRGWRQGSTQALLRAVSAMIQTVSAMAAMVRSQVRPVVEALTYQASIRPDRPVPVSRM